MMTIDIDNLAELYYQHVDPQFQNDEEVEEAEVLSYIGTEIDRIFDDLDADQLRICQDNVDQIIQYIEEKFHE